ncbi:MAG: NADPH-dependent FMN reductase [Deinococcus sp.]|uniref:NADPH-dependent FMN reductase n=1 Tax=Deinococcus sp. TaxID=47478 RepID=UPI0026DCE30D|nr:NADPH-dependent FMN reductase [Deinococcus sp.]MDO4247223.1 NADPH-dependent FMN reductase [Deinococcus sp.]
MRVLLLCGSLRAESVNRALLRAFAEQAPAAAEVQFFDGLNAIPIFNPDHEKPEPESVKVFRLALEQADAVVVACPEYAHGIPGAFKNALDWVVSSTGLQDKPTLVLTALGRSRHVPMQLAEVLSTMSARILGPYLAGIHTTVAAAQAELQTPTKQVMMGKWWNELEEATKG